MYQRMRRKPERRKIRRRIRGKIHGTAERPRIAIFRSSRHLYAQAIDDEKGHTIASASSVDKECRAAAGDKGSSGTDLAKIVGTTIAERLKKQGIESVVFDRGGFLYHGRTRAVAEAAREGGLKF